MDENQPEFTHTKPDEPDDAQPGEVEAVNSDELNDDETAELDDSAFDELDDDDTAELDDDDTAELDDDELDESAGAGPGGDIEDLVRYVASRLVQDPDELTVESEFRGGTVYVSLRVPEAEMGRVIGREGRTAKAIRTLVSIAGSRQNVHARLDIDG